MWFCSYRYFYSYCDSRCVNRCWFSLNIIQYDGKEGCSRSNFGTEMQYKCGNVITVKGFNVVFSSVSCTVVKKCFYFAWLFSFNTQISITNTDISLSSKVKSFSVFGMSPFFALIAVCRWADNVGYLNMRLNRRA